MASAAVDLNVIRAVETTLIPFNNHFDVITHVEINVYGLVMATCSADRVINVWERKDHASAWEHTATFKTHTGSIVKVRLCHPFQGHAMATCSLDSKIHIFEEANRSKFPPTDKPGEKGHWQRRCVLSCYNSTLVDMQFCPYYTGVMLAVCSNEGHVMIYEAPDPLDLTFWASIYEIQIGDYDLSSVAWDFHRFTEFPILAVGSNDPAAPTNYRLTILEINPKRAKLTDENQVNMRPDEVINSVAFAASNSVSFSRLAASSANKVYIFSVHYEKDEEKEKYRIHGLTRLMTVLEEQCFPIKFISWNCQGNAIVAMHVDGSIRIFEQNVNRVWSRKALINPPKTRKAANQLCSPVGANSDEETEAETFSRLTQNYHAITKMNSPQVEQAKNVSAERIPTPVTKSPEYGPIQPKSAPGTKPPSQMTSDRPKAPSYIEGLRRFYFGRKFGLAREASETRRMSGRDQMPSSSLRDEHSDEPETGGTANRRILRDRLHDLQDSAAVTRFGRSV